MPAPGFLSAVFKPLPATEVNPLFRPANYRYLYATAKNYAGLLGREFPLAPGEEDFRDVCQTLDSLLPENMEMRLYEEGNRLRLRIIENLDSNTLYYIPCRIIGESQGIFREILLGFFRLLQYRQRLTPLLESLYFDIWRDDVENYCGNTGCAPDDEWQTILKSYTEGEIAGILKLVDGKPGCDEAGLGQLIDGYTPRDGKEEKILDLVKKGLEFLRTGKVLLHYTASPRDNGDEEPVTADNLFMIVYDDDMVMENMIEYMNNYANEYGYEFFSSTGKTISPRTKKPAVPDRFVTDFITWINEFCDALYHG